MNSVVDLSLTNILVPYPTIFWVSSLTINIRGHLAIIPVLALGGEGITGACLSSSPGTLTPTISFFLRTCLNTGLALAWSTLANLRHTGFILDRLIRPKRSICQRFPQIEIRP